LFAPSFLTFRSRHSYPVKRQDNCSALPLQQKICNYLSLADLSFEGCNKDDITVICFEGCNVSTGAEDMHITNLLFPKGICQKCPKHAIGNVSEQP
jgi:hypothetical protein